MMSDFYLGDMSVFELRKFYPDWNDSFKERKRKRTEFYLKHIYKNKLKECTACGGYRYYCGNACGCCDGTGKTRER